MSGARRPGLLPAGRWRWPADGSSRRGAGRMTLCGPEQPARARRALPPARGRRGPHDIRRWWSTTAPTTSTGRKSTRGGTEAMAYGATSTEAMACGRKEGGRATAAHTASEEAEDPHSAWRSRGRGDPGWIWMERRGRGGRSARLLPRQPPSELRWRRACGVAGLRRRCPALAQSRCVSMGTRARRGTGAHARCHLGAAVAGPREPGATRWQLPAQPALEVELATPGLGAGANLDDAVSAGASSGMASCGAGVRIDGPRGGVN